MHAFGMWNDQVRVRHNSDWSGNLIVVYYEEVGPSHHRSRTWGPHAMDLIHGNSGTDYKDSNGELMPQFVVAAVAAKCVRAKLISDVIAYLERGTAF